MASFEGKPVTNDHPPGIIGPDDVRLYEMGHAENIRRGSDEWADYILADLHIHAGELIDAIQNGKREVSCGYECDYVQDEDGSYSQKNIRGNHIAVVDRGRAGKRAAILDSEINQPAGNPPERKVTMKSKILELFGLAAKDRSPEEIAQMAQDAASVMDEGGEGPAQPPEKKETEEKPAADGCGASPFESIDDAALDGLLEKLMARKAAKEAAAKEADGDPLEKTIKALTGEAAGDPEEAHVVPAEEMDKGCGSALDKALAAEILKTMRPVVAGIKDEKQRMAVSDALIKCVTAQDGASDIAKIMQAAQKNAQDKAAKSPAADLDAIQAAYDACNPHKVKKEAK